MADQLADPADLASLLGRDDIDAYKATLLVEMSTAIVQEAAGGQRIVQVVDDEIELQGTTEAYLNLPQIPVTAVTSVILDGVTLTAGTDYTKVGNRLWRRTGWQSNWGQYAAQSYAVGPGAGVEIAYSYNYGQRDFFAGVSEAQPSIVQIVNTHGYAPGRQELQLGRSSVLSMCSGAFSNPRGLKAEQIDDYSVTYGALAGQLEASPYLKAAIRKQYGRRGGLVRIG